MVTSSKLSIARIELIILTEHSHSSYIPTRSPSSSHLLFLRTLAWWNGWHYRSFLYLATTHCFVSCPFYPLHRVRVSSSLLSAHSLTNCWWIMSKKAHSVSVTNCCWIMSSRTHQFAVLGIMCNIFISFVSSTCVCHTIYIIYQMYVYYGHYLNKHMYVVYYSGASI